MREKKKTVGTVQWKMGAPQGVRGRPFTLNQRMVESIPEDSMSPLGASLRLSTEFSCSLCYLHHIFPLAPETPGERIQHFNIHRSPTRGADPRAL